MFIESWLTHVLNITTPGPPRIAAAPSRPPVAASATTVAPSTTKPAPVISPPYVLELLPFVEIGVKAVRSGPKRNPPSGEYRVACPADRPYCIDYKMSDNGTCMYPDPLEIKRCYDASCQNSPWAPIVFRTQGEQTYCKDFMTPAGRVCQWIDGAACTCSSKSISYYDGVFIGPGEPMPVGFTQANPCTYPLDLIRQAAEEAARRARDRKGNRERRRARRGEPDSEDEQGTDETRKRNPNVPPASRAENAKGLHSRQGVLGCMLSSIILLWVI